MRVCEEGGCVALRCVFERVRSVCTVICGSWYVVCLVRGGFEVFLLLVKLAPHAYLGAGGLWSSRCVDVTSPTTSSMRVAGAITLRSDYTHEVVDVDLYVCGCNHIKYINVWALCVETSVEWVLGPSQGFSTPDYQTTSDRG